MSPAELTLHTSRLTLVPLAEEHAPLLFPLMRDERISTYLAWAPHAELDETARVVGALIAAQNRGAGYHWTILEGGEVRGLISLIDVQRTHRLWTLNRAEIAYWIDPATQGRGIATEAARAVVACAFEMLGMNRLKISHTSANPASGRIPQKLGFRFIGSEREFFQKNGQWFDMNHYEMLAEEWPPRDPL